MTKQQILLSLAERCEAATGPDRNLDAAINRGLRGSGSPSWMPYRTAPKFTASLDAALTLVPEGMDWGIAHFGPRGSEAQIWPRGDHDSERKVTGGSDGAIAFALTAAALRAHAAEAE